MVEQNLVGKLIAVRTITNTNAQITINVEKPDNISTHWLGTSAQNPPFLGKRSSSAQFQTGRIGR